MKILTYGEVLQKIKVCKMIDDYTLFIKLMDNRKIFIEIPIKHTGPKQVLWIQNEIFKYMFLRSSDYVDFNSINRYLQGIPYQNLSD